MARKLTFLVSVFFFIMVVAGVAFAIPGLQLDISGEGAIYDGGSETTLTSDSMFTLYALLELGEKYTLGQTYAISVSIYDKMDEATPTPDFGSVNISGAGTSDDYSFETYGTPPMATGDLPDHEAFPSYFSQIPGFQFTSSQQMTPYNVQDDSDVDPADKLGGTGMYYVAFDVDTSSVMDGYLIHFDLYDINDGSLKAPFSKDAGTRVPEPGTLVLLGIGMLGVAALRRKTI